MPNSKTINQYIASWIDFVANLAQDILCFPVVLVLGWDAEEK